jgi:hypothetical protein
MDQQSTNGCFSWWVTQCLQIFLKRERSVSLKRQFRIRREQSLTMSKRGVSKRALGTRARRGYLLWLGIHAKVEPFHDPTSSWIGAQSLGCEFDAARAV